MTFKSTAREALLSWKAAPAADLVPRLAQQQRIARCIHQVFFSPSSAGLPGEIERSIEQIRRANLGWDYRLYGAQQMLEFISRHYGERVLNYFQRISPLYGAARADLFRYLLMYQAGGVYLDIKSTLTRSLDEVLQPEDCYLLSHWRNGSGEEFQGWGLHPELAGSAGEFQQWHIVAAAGHPFLRAVIERVLRNIARYNPVLHGQGWIGVLRTTGPVAYTLAIEPLRALYSHRLVDAQRELGFQYSIYPQARGSVHQQLFTTHHARLNAPVVRLGVTDKLLSGALMAYRRTRAVLAHGSSR